MPYYTWLIIAGIFLAAELTSGTFYLLMFSIAAFFTWIAQISGAGFLAQGSVFLISSVALIGLVHYLRSYYAKTNTKVNQADDLDAGEIITVKDWKDGIGHTFYRGANWRVVLNEPDQQPLTDGSYRIVKLDGTRIRAQRLPAAQP